jgi:hypothetical protein
LYKRLVTAVGAVWAAATRTWGMEVRCSPVWGKHTTTFDLPRDESRKVVGGLVEGPGGRLSFGWDLKAALQRAYHAIGDSVIRPRR